ncbi:MAG: CocE/NonD family hydrolase [Nakamurella sp.]
MNRPAGNAAPLLRYVGVPAADGSALATVIVDAQQPVSEVTLLWRSPYGRAAHLGEAFGWARRGFRVVLQDVRGRHDSEGTFEPYQNERADGLATLEWIARQGISGAIITYGASYAAHCALAPAGATPLAGVLATVPALDHASCIRERNGAPRLYAHAQWWLEHGDTRIPRGPLLDLLAAGDPDLFAAIPVAQLPARWGIELPGFAAAWNRTTDHPTTSGMNLLRSWWARATEPIPPLLCIGGWADACTDDALQLWQEWPHPSARLLIGPWAHTLRAPVDTHWGAVGTAKVGALAASWVDDEDGVRSRGTRALISSPRCLAGTRVAPTPGWSRWDRYPPGPPTDTPQVEHTLDARTATTFDADPWYPHPSRLGHVPVDDVLVRTDAAVFGSARVQEGVVLGAPRVLLDGLGSTPGGVVIDWAIRLILQAPDTPALQVGTACVRTADTRTETSLPAVHLIVPDGSRWQVQITAHQFPLYPRDPQTGENPLTATDLRSARRSISTVLLLLPGASDPADCSEEVTALWSRP